MTDTPKIAQLMARLDFENGNLVKICGHRIDGRLVGDRLLDELRKAAVLAKLLHDENERLREALREIRQRMGGEDLSNGWNGPEDVWGIATAALAKGSSDE